MDACTIVSPRELARARVLAATLAEHAPSWRLTVLVLAQEAPVAEEGFLSLGLDDLAGADEWGMIAAANPPGALAMALLPLLVRASAERGRSDAVAYIGAGQRVLGPLGEFEQALAVSQTVLVARAVASERRDGAFAADVARGVFSGELIGLRLGGAAQALLERWPRSFADGGNGGSAAVARWLDGIPALSQDVAIVRDAGYGLDPVSLGARTVAERSGGLEVDGRPARTIDFAELDPLRPAGAFEGEGRAQLSTKPALAALVARHASDLLAAGYGRDAAKARAIERLPDGLLLTPVVRALVLEAVRDGELTRSPFTQAGREELYAYLNAPADQGRHVGLTRLHVAIWHSRPELRAGYPHLTGPDGVGFAGWLCTHGAEQLGLVGALLPPVPDVAYRDADPHKGVYKRWGVNVVGFFTAELGIGEAARLLITGLDARGIPALPIQGNIAPPSRQGAAYAYSRPEQAAYPINVICINGDGLAVFAREAGRSFFAGRYTIALWFWEVGDPPAEWGPAYEFIDEVWVASEHVYDAISPHCPVPVVRITLPVLEPELAPLGRAELGLPEEDFVFLFVHDYHSASARKNPEGLIEAFKRAFAPGAGPKLVLKSINAPTRPVEHERIELAAAGREDIVLIDGYVSAPQKNAMIAQCDCYVSLHRSEGFGLTLAEALLLERPVIATRFGGTQEFLEDANAYLVGWTPVRVGEGVYQYPADGVWAEPDLDEAARLMRHVFEHPDQARQRAREGRKKLLERFSPDAAGAVAERRLRYIYEERLPAEAQAFDVEQIESALDPADSENELASHRRGLEEHRLAVKAHGRGLAEEIALAARIADVPQVAMGSGVRYSARAKLLRPLVTWARLYAEHQAELGRDMNHVILELEERMLRLDSRFLRLDERLLSLDERMVRLEGYVRAVGQSIEDAQRELRAELLSRLRQSAG